MRDLLPKLSSQASLVSKPVVTCSAAGPGCRTMGKATRHCEEGLNHLPHPDQQHSLADMPAKGEEHTHPSSHCVTGIDSLTA